MKIVQLREDFKRVGHFGRGFNPVASMPEGQWGLKKVLIEIAR